MAEDDITGIENLYPQQREGYAEEDDRIDEMLPSEKRRRVDLIIGQEKGEERAHHLIHVSQRLLST